MATEPKAKFELTAQNKTGRVFKQVNSDLSRLGGGVRSLLGPLAAIAGTAAFVSFAKNTLASADAIGKFADRIGISTKALQEYRFAFDLAGVSQEETDKGLLTFSKRIGEARAGTGAMVEILRRLNPELLNTIINSRSESEALELVFKGMGKAKSAAEKNAIANAALGRAGVKMTAAFKAGSAAFFEATREASRLGLVIDEKLIRNAEKLNDDFTRASGIIGVQFKSAFLDLAPAINDAVLAFTRFIKLARESRTLNSGLSGNPSTDEAARFVEAEIGRMERFIDLLEQNKFVDPVFGFEVNLPDSQKNIEQIKAARAELDGLKQILDNIKKSSKGNGKPLNGGADDGKNSLAIDALIKKFRSAAQSESEKLQSLIDDLNKAVAGGLSQGEADKVLNKRLEEIEKRRAAGDKAGIALEKQLERRKKLLESENKEFRQFQADLFSGIPDAFGKVDLTETFSEEQLEALVNRIDEVGGSFESLIPILDKNAEAAQAAGLNLDQQFSDLPVGEVEKLNKALADETRILELLKDPLDEAAHLENILDDRLRAGTIGALDHAEAVKRLHKEFGLLKDEADPMIAALDRIASGLENNVTDVLFDAIQGTNSLRENTKRMVDFMLKEILRLQVARPIIEGLFGKSGSGGGLVGDFLNLFKGGGATQGGGASASNPIATNTGKLFGPGFAHGGSFEVGGPGGTDRTPVNFMATRGERVTIQTPQQQGQGGGIVVNNHFHISTGVVPTVRAEVTRMLPSIKEHTKAAVRDAVQRGGQFAGAF